MFIASALKCRTLAKSLICANLLLMLKLGPVHRDKTSRWVHFHFFFSVYSHSSEPLSDTKCPVRLVLRSCREAERHTAQAEALGFQMEAPARAGLRMAKIHTYRLFCDFRHSTFCWLWQPAGTPGSSRSWPREALARRETLLSGVQIKETRYNVLIGHRQGL